MHPRNLLACLGLGACCACSSPIGLRTSTAGASTGAVSAGATGGTTGATIGSGGGSTSGATGTGATGGCVGSLTDPANCGTCRNVCALDAVCSAGICVGADGGPAACQTLALVGPGCPDGLACLAQEGACEVADCAGVSDGTDCVRGLDGQPLFGTCCGGRCADLTTDPEDCGACGTVCSSGVCFSDLPVSGIIGCFPPLALDDGGPACVQGDTPGRACGLDAGNGVCCPTNSAPGFACVDLLGDPANCGGCNLACDAGSCGSGVCGSATALTCGAALGDFCDLDAGSFSAVCCASGCGTLDADRNCGSCGHDCTASGEVCVAEPLCGFASCAGLDAGAVCALDAGVGSCCGGAGCIDLLSDPQNCGACGLSCADAGGPCAAGTCLVEQCTSANAASNAACALGTGIGFCCAAGDCADLLTDPQNCGGCGLTCTSGQTCALGACG